MISNTCKTAIKAVIYLASRNGNPTKASIRDIAQHIDASEHTVGKMLQSLVRQDIINSTKGPAGGFFITSDQEQQPIMTIVQTIDGNHLFTGCGLGLTKCSEEHPCPIHDQYKGARDIIIKIFSNNTIGDLRHSVSNGLAYLLG
ncbi:MAG: transcriptional regulator [Bacteroidetes bacterium]|jgi:Rrf2 family protein|nr:transcriptional regulator [Bacteroidota bacterium]